MLSDWPVYSEERHFPEEEAMIARAKDLVRGMRNLRTDMEVPPSRKAKIIITSDDENVRNTFTAIQDTYMSLAGATEISIQAGKDGISEDAVSVVIPDAVLYIPLEDLVDFEKEKERLTKEKEKLQKELARSKGMLSNEKFISKAPAEKVAEERAKMEKYQQMMDEVVARLNQMK